MEVKKYLYIENRLTKEKYAPGGFFFLTRERYLAHAQAHEFLLGPPWKIEEWTPPEPEPEPLVEPWDRVIIDELPTSAGPFSASGLRRDEGWWQRTLDQIDAITIHHTTSGSPHATARNYTRKSGNRPSIPYTVWVTETGEVLLCRPLTDGLWHDHTGHENTHLSVGMAGHLHLHRPSDVQLAATVKVCTWAILSDDLPLVLSASQVKGHQDHFKTQCPGWDMQKGNEGSGMWRDDFYALLLKSLPKVDAHL